MSRSFPLYCGSRSTGVDQRILCGSCAGRVAMQVCCGSCAYPGQPCAAASPGPISSARAAITTTPAILAAESPGSPLDIPLLLGIQRLCKPYCCSVCSAGNGQITGLLADFGIDYA